VARTSDGAKPLLKILEARARLQSARTA